MKSSALMNSHLNSSGLYERFAQCSCKVKSSWTGELSTKVNDIKLCNSVPEWNLSFCLQSRRRHENTGWVCCCLCTDSDSYARIPPPPPRGKSYEKGSPTREGLRVLMAAPMYLFTKSKQWMKREAAQQGGGEAAWWSGLWNSSNPVSLDRYWQSLMR